MAVVNVVWTEQQIHEIIDRWNRNESMREIAAAMGLRRSQISGKLNRLYTTHAAAVTRGRDEKMKRRKSEYAARVQHFQENIRFATIEPDDDLVYVTRVRRGQCHYPTDAPEDAAFSFVFCGKETEDQNKCYCAQHHALTHWKEARPMNVKELLRIR